MNADGKVYKLFPKWKLAKFVSFSHIDLSFFYLVFDSPEFFETISINTALKILLQIIEVKNGYNFLFRTIVPSN